MARSRQALLAVLGVLASARPLAPHDSHTAAGSARGREDRDPPQNFTEAATGCNGLAAAGNAEAQYLLAAFYLNGVNGPRDVAQAKAWLEKSAGQKCARRIQPGETCSPTRTLPTAKRQRTGWRARGSWVSALPHRRRARRHAAGTAVESAACRATDGSGGQARSAVARRR